MSKPRGRPPKKQKTNLMGLRNASQPSPSLPDTSKVPPPPPDVSRSGETDLTSVSVYLDSTRINWELDDAIDKESDGELDADALGNTDLTGYMIDMDGTLRDDDDDEWLPPALKKKKNVKKTGRPTEYKKGPDMMSKAPRTRHRHKSSWATQSKLDSFWLHRVDPEVIVIDDSSSDESAVPSSSLRSRHTSPDAIVIDDSSDEPGAPSSSLKRSRSASSGSEFIEEMDEMAELSSVISYANSTSSSYAASPSNSASTSYSAPPSTSASPASSHGSLIDDVLDIADDISYPAVASSSGVTDSAVNSVISPTGGEVILDVTDIYSPDHIEADIAAMPEIRDIDGEVWEDELDENVSNPLASPQPWDVLRSKIREDIKKRSKVLSPSQLNQLFVLSNFATLRLKGYSRIQASRLIADQWKDGQGTWFARRVRDLARHYQIFEQLPQEHRGGFRMSRSFLHDEAVRSEVVSFLNNVPAGKITPKAFAKHVNEVIFPELGITPARPLSVRTARRWLIKLGWRYSVVRKGVYMDGHERKDVVEYRDEIFLPLMEKFEARMVQYVGQELQRVEPVLAAGELEIIPLFHDECCFHANDMVFRVWQNTAQGKQPIRKKGRGRLIHVSDFLNPEEGRLIIRDNEGEITHDARQIIFPSADGDPWWDTKQLLAQVERAIRIFELAHPGKQALFIFDQSSAHAALPSDALKAFEMNKSDGGKQRKQKDTVIPMSNPVPELRGRPQSMSLANGNPKGLKRVLEERGFNIHKLKSKCSPVCPFENKNCCMARLLSQQDDFVNQPSMLETLIKGAGHECMFLPKFHCELNPIEMYWGWCKYRYRETDKKDFAAAKAAAVQYLDACPVEVIRRFINRSWRFMSAYRLGLTGKAAEWAVRRQKQHRVVSEAAMKAMESILPQPRLSEFIYEVRFWKKNHAGALEDLLSLTVRNCTRPWVYYRGLSTVVQMSILGAKPLPPHRLTLQKRGWRTGLLGWSVGSWLGGTIGKEVDVTPDTVVSWNEDYNGKEGKVEEKKRQQYDKEINVLAPEGHKVLETDLVHIPVASGDGYFRILVYPTSSHTPIASTATFRVGSLSLASACPRGASPITLLPELALKSASVSGSALAWGTFYTFFPFLKIAEMIPGTHSWGTWALRRAYEWAGGDVKLEEAKERLKVEERRKEVEKSIYVNVPFGSMGVRTAYDLEEDHKQGKGGVMFRRDQ